MARIGAYRPAIAAALGARRVPDIRLDDPDGRRKYGAAAIAETAACRRQENGLFARAGWNDGCTESFAFREDDRTPSAGAQLSGPRWGRADDRLGVAVAENGLSEDHRAYRVAGGSGFLFGDNALRDGREKIAKAYYSASLVPHVMLAPDFELIRNPGYKRDRGPACFVALRLHLEL